MSDPSVTVNIRKFVRIRVEVAMNVNESISVSTEPSGSPVAFTWRGIRYVVVSEAEIWFTKIPWWRGAQHIPHIERQIWRVSALPCSGPRSLQSQQPDEGVYDLCQDVSQGWLLLTAHSDELDTQLFA